MPYYIDNQYNKIFNLNSGQLIYINNWIAFDTNHCNKTLLYLIGFWPIFLDYIIGKIVIKNNYKRPGLTNNIPVDSEGNIRSPFDSSYARGAVLQLTRDKFKFGDHSPVENTWRRSVHYPFSLLKSYILHQPNKAIGIGLDTNKISRNASGQIVIFPAVCISSIALRFFSFSPNWFLIKPDNIQLHKLPFLQYRQL